MDITSSASPRSGPGRALPQAPGHVALDEPARQVAPRSPPPAKSIAAPAALTGRSASATTPQALLPTPSEERFSDSKMADVDDPDGAEFMDDLYSVLFGSDDDAVWQIEAGGRLIARHVWSVCQDETTTLSPDDPAEISGLYSDGFASCTATLIVSEDCQWISLSHDAALVEDMHDRLRADVAALQTDSKQECTVTVAICRSAMEKAIRMDEIEHEYRPGKSVRFSDFKSGLLAERFVKNRMHQWLDEVRAYAATVHANLIDMPHGALLVERGTGLINVFDDFDAAPVRQAMPDDEDVVMSDGAGAGAGAGVGALG